jgi:hypothetical protein
MTAGPRAAGDRRRDQVAPNAGRVLRRLGLGEALAEVAVRLEGG